MKYALVCSHLGHGTAGHSVGHQYQAIRERLTSGHISPSFIAAKDVVDLLPLQTRA